MTIEETGATKAPSRGILLATVVVNASLAFGLFLYFAYTRNVDGDEGLYLEASRLVSHGRLPYFDFFFQQMPMLPYLYAGWMRIFGFDFFAARWLSALLSALGGAACFLYVARRTKSLFDVNLAALLFFANALVLAWAAVTKTHPLNVFCLTVSAVCLLEWRHRGGNSLSLVLAAGFSLGLGLNARLTLGPFVPIYILFIFVFARYPWRSVLVFAIAVGILSIPTLYFFLRDPELFIKYNLIYHTTVYPGVADRDKRWEVARGIFLQPQFLVLLLLAQLALWFRSREGWRNFFRSDEGFLGFLIFVFFVIHMSTAEPFTQYFVAVVPWMIMLAVPLLHRIRVLPRFAWIVVYLFFGFFYLLPAKANIDFEISSMMSGKPEWKLSNVKRVVSAAKKLLRPGQACVTWWPGYAFMAGCGSVRGMENHMRSYAVQRLDAEGMREYKMLPDGDLWDLLAGGDVPVVIDGVYRLHSPMEGAIDHILDEKYQMKSSVCWPTGAEKTPGMLSVEDLICYKIFKRKPGEGIGKGAPMVGVKSGSRLVVHRPNRN